MKEELAMNSTEHWGTDSGPAADPTQTLTPEEIAFWEEGLPPRSKSGDDEDWEADQLTDSGSSGNDSFTLKYMDEEKTVTREEVVTLAQKGMDYDRVRRRLDETGSALKEFEELRESMGLRGAQLRWLDELAREQGMSLDAMLEDKHVQLLSSKTGRSREECQEEIRRQQAQWKQRQSARQRRNEDIAAFSRAYPEQAQDPGKIPRQVWEQVRRGETLLNAYRTYEVEELRREVARQKAELQKHRDRDRSTGSQLSRGTKWVDPFEALWYAED